jgi:glycosyltransferase involved in cell wall biosynthesis
MRSVQRPRCDLHVHSVHSTDSGNYALRRARLGESYTEPGRLYEICRRRGMSLVTISDHNTLEGAVRIADRPGTFLSVEVTTRFPEDDVPLHVLVWNLTEEDHRDLQPYRPSVYELVAFLHERELAHALAHPLYQMGAPLTAWHVERMMLLFGIWEGRNGARPRDSNLLATKLATTVTLALTRQLSERHELAPRHEGTIVLSGGSDDHGALDIATTWTESAGETVEEFLAGLRAGQAEIGGEHGSSVKLAHAVGALVLNAYRASGRALPPVLADEVAVLFDGDSDGFDRHEGIVVATSAIARGLGDRARSGALELDALPTIGHRLGAVLLAGFLEAPFVGAVRHHAQTRAGVRRLEQSLLGVRRRQVEPSAIVFTDTFDETNGVAGTMRRLAGAGATGQISLTVATCTAAQGDEPGRLSFPPDWSFPVPAYETLDLRVPSLTQVLERIEREQPDVIHLATPGPVGLCGLAAAKILGLPVVGSYHTELGPYALHLTRDLLVAEALDHYVDWFYRQCAILLAPTVAVAEALERRGFAGRTGVWGRGVDAELFAPARRSTAVRERILDGGELLLLSVGRLSHEKRLEVLLEAFGRVADELPGARLAIAGEGPARASLEALAPEGVEFVGELHGHELAALYASADVFCFPSTSDTFGQVILEAAASGLPVVAAAAGGAAELVRHGRTGLLVPPDDAAALARSLLELALSPERRQLLGLAARAAAVERTWTHSLGELAEAYQAVMGLSVPSGHRAAA